MRNQHCRFLRNCLTNEQDSPGHLQMLQKILAGQREVVLFLKSYWVLKLTLFSIWHQNALGRLHSSKNPLISELF